MNKLMSQILLFLDQHLGFPNLFENDEARSERLLAVYLWSFMVLVTMGCIIVIVRDPSQIVRPLLIIIILDSLHLFLYTFMKRRLIGAQTVAILTIGITWVLITFVILTGGGVHSPAFSGYLMLTFLAGITLGQNYMLTVAFASGLAGFAFEILEVSGMLPPSYYRTSHFSFALLQGIMLFMLVILQYYASTLVNKAISKAREELTERKLKEKELSESQKRFASIFEYSPVPTSLTQADNNHLLAVNPMWQDLTGFTREEVVGKSIHDLKVWVTPQDRNRLLALLEKQDRVQDFESLLRRKDDQLRNISVSVAKINIDGVDCLIFQTLDITEKLALERSLRESNERFDQITHHIPQVFWISERIGGLVYVSPAFENIYGRPASDFYYLHKEYIEVVHPEDRHIVEDAFEKELQGKSIEMEYRIIRQDGEIRWIHDRAIPVLDQEGQLLRTIGVATDITHRRESEAERRELISILQDAEEQVGLASWAQDLTRDQGRWSPHMFALFGFDPAEGVPDMQEFLDRIHPEDRAVLGGALAGMVRGMETTEPFIYRTNPEHGEMRILKPTYRVEKDPNGQILKFTGTVLDITERKRSEMEREYRQKLLEKVIQAGKNITSVTDFDLCLREIHRNIIETLGFDRVGLFLYDEENKMVKGVYGTSRNGQLERNDWYSKLVEEWSDWQVALKSPSGYSMDDDFEATHNPPPGDEMHGVKQHVTLAAWAGGKPVALLTVDNLMTQKPITQADLEALQLYAGYAGLAMENASMHTVLEQRVIERTEDLRHSQERLQLFLDTASDLIQSLDEKGNYLYVNQAWCRTLGYTVKEALSLNMMQIVQREYQEHCLKMFQNLMDTQSPQKIEVAFLTKSGGMVIVEGSVNINLDKSGHRVTNGFFRDITERKLAEAALRESEATYRALFENSNDGIFLLSPTGEELKANQYAIDMLGYTNNEYWEKSRSKTNPFTTDPGQREDAISKLSAALRGEKLEPYERVFARKDGSTLPVEITLSPIHDTDGNIIMIQSVARDITQRKLAEETMRNANIEMERALRIKDEFMATMSHELRTPLNAVLGLSESLLEETAGPITERQAKYLSTISESGRHLLELINDILDLAKIESGQIGLTMGTVNVHKVCETCIHLINQLAKKKHHKLELHIENGIDTMQADERRLKQMIVNLLGNAIKFTPEYGRIGLQVSEDLGSGMLHFEVWDTGIGIAENDIERIFKPFTQLDSGLARETSGTGLGLTLVRQMALLHGGTIHATSQPGKGSRFTLALPIHS